MVKLIFTAIIGVYLVTHLWGLLNLPVFADESIYIRWAQLIIDDWREYLFFPMNDGKTPLFMWLLVPFQFVFSDQLYAARIVSVLVGVGQIGANVWCIRLLGGTKLAKVLGALFVTILPFWFFHHRMALIDGTLTLFLTLSLASYLEVVTRSFTFQNRDLLQLKKVFRVALREPWLLLSGILFGLALWTKVPAILFTPTFVFFAFLPKNKSYTERLLLLLQSGSVIAVGLVFFLVLKTQPVFSQLFSRGSDFLYPWQEVLEGKWRDTIISFPTYGRYFLLYLTPTATIVSLIGLLMRKQRRAIFVLLLAALSFIGPIAVLGKVVYPRYFMPAIIPLTLAASIALSELFRRAKDGELSLRKRAVFAVVAVLLLANSLVRSVAFIYPSLTNANATPFVSADVTQYLSEWSSGHGIQEAVALINAQAKQGTIAVATEGFFGTLPDGILMYLHRRDVTNIMVQGIGQPVRGIPDAFLKQASAYETVWLVVNSHRMQMQTEDLVLVAEFCRPDNAPCLQVWDITNLQLL
ncbi:MAG: phospholipid carrier-dependent glycosyltransferase [bacterium]|nr:phospholipid carrier-dependent glycosyltransferase [bacterium]